MMQRRLMLAALAAAAAAPAFAQTGDKSAPMSKEPMSKDMTSPATGNQADMAGAMGAPEQKHVMDTMAVGAMSLAASRVAVKKARDEDVKEFAKFEVAEQETVADVLMSLKDPSKASGKMNPPSDAEVMQHVPKEDQAMMEKMEAMDGKAFDKAYVKAQVDGHKKLLQIQETYLADGKNPTNLAVAKLARGQIKEHLKLLADIRDDDDDDKGATTGKSRK